MKILKDKKENNNNNKLHCTLLNELLISPLVKVLMLLILWTLPDEGFQSQRNKITIYCKVMHTNILLRRCFSFIGRVIQVNGQELSIGTNCAVLSVIVHEVLHALGFIHEHTRLDRDKFVIINETNIQPGRDVSRAIFLINFSLTSISH